ncbi:MAG: epoxyqueuosine reductase QueH [Clostridia bacterium]|nr:epoxyqueuosine reductase QueH [Clostridia bacterium]
MQEYAKNQKPRMLLHSCCGPCSSTVILRLKENFDLTVLYYNPNIFPEEEYLHRKKVQLDLIKKINKEYGEDVKVLDAEYDPETYEKFVCGLENEKEGGARCEKCFELRLSKTANLAKENGFDIFATTLTVSPHKNAPLINAIGQKIAEEVGIDYLVSDFKKQDGYKTSIELSKKYNLYRQNYCGCKYSMWFLKRPE